MNHIRFASVTLLFLSLAACGDAREEFRGNYGFRGEYTVGVGTNAEVFPVLGQLEVVADHFESERIFLNWDCGLFGKVEDGAMTLIPKICPAREEEECDFIYKYERGGASIDGDKLDLTMSGNVKVQCRNESGSVYIAIKLKGVRGAPAPRSGELREEPEASVSESPAVRDALLRWVAPRAQVE